MSKHQAIVPARGIFNPSVSLAFSMDSHRHVLLTFCPFNWALIKFGWWPDSGRKFFIAAGPFRASGWYYLMREDQIIK